MEGGGGKEIIYLSLHCHHQNDFCIKMGSDDSHFNVSVESNGQSHKTVSTNHNLFLFFFTSTLNKYQKDRQTVIETHREGDRDQIIKSKKEKE